VLDQFKLSKTYDAAKFEENIYKDWLQAGAFHAKPDDRGADRSYVIMMPLPNVTGALHMGHALDNVMQDMLIRWHRMLGDNSLWMPGTDHAGIATQAVVEKRIKELEGLDRHDVGREGLVERIWKWKDQFQARIVAQQQRMGCSADWDRQRFTMDKVCSRAVRYAFLRMFKDGLIFRGKRLVNWDAYLRTSISDDEVYHETVQGHFWHLFYPVIDPQGDDPQEVVVATTRPETMLGDTAVAVHPEPDKALADEIEKVKSELQKAKAKERKALKLELEDLEEREQEMLPRLLYMRDMARAGRKVMLPLLDRPIPLICDEWAKPSLGTGCVKITPAHDQNDYDVWSRHMDEIDIINILNPDGTLNENAGPYAGLDRFEARDRVVTDLDAKGLMGEIEDRQIEIGYSDRSKTPIEPYLSDQWFIYMGDVEGGVVMGSGTPKKHKSPGLVQAAIDAAKDGRVSFHPERFLKTYLDWLEEKRDWPISRQLWWGHRIPVWSRQVPEADTPGLVKDTISKALNGLWPEKASVRIVYKDEGSFVQIEDPDTLPSLPVDPEGTWLVDVCLLEDDPKGIQQLEALGFEQDPDVLDTWFSSALWPHSTLGWPDPATAETEGGASLGPEDNGLSSLQTYYPGSCLVTARDIITLWVARMVITGLYNLGDVPFSDVFIHANILDGKGELMSKSKGNGIDPVDIIYMYGTDAMRYVLCDMQTGNQDIRLPVTAVCPHCEEHNDLAKAKHGRSVFTFMCYKCKKEFDVLGTMPDVPDAKLISERFIDGRKFCNKLWNTARFALGHLEDVPVAELEHSQLAIEDRWILAALNQAIRTVSSGLREYNPSAALGAARAFMWGELCDWYLELIKPRLNNPSDSSAALARQVLAYCLDQTLRLLHPFVPFITEYLYQQLAKQVPRRSIPGLVDQLSESDMLIMAQWPVPAESLDDSALLQTFADLQAATTGVRDLRSTHGLSHSQQVEVSLRPQPEREADLKTQGHVIRRLANVSSLTIDADVKRPAGAASKVVGDLQIFVHGLVDDAEEKKRLQKEIKRIQKEIDICENKLSNKKFISNAPDEVVQEQNDRLAKYSRQKEAIQGALDEIHG
jgi:valyl-tRNA synthetase